MSTEILERIRPLEVVVVDHVPHLRVDFGHVLRVLRLGERLVLRRAGLTRFVGKC
jgi:hypothetical protein